MGGGHSGPIVITRHATKPLPNDNTHRGLRVEEAEGCAHCALIIDSGVSASTATLTINPVPVAKNKTDPNNLTIPDPTDITKDVNPNIYLPSNSITITPSAPFTGSFNIDQPMPWGVGQVWWDQMELFWGAPLRVEGGGGAGAQADACLLVRSTSSYIILMIPIQKTTDGTKKGCAFFQPLASNFLGLSGRQPPTTSYDPTQDPHIASQWEKLGAGDTETVKVRDKIHNYIKYASDGHYDTGGTREDVKPYPSSTVDTGSAWTLSSLVTGKEAFFTWVDTVYGLNDSPADNTSEERAGFRFDTEYKAWSALGSSTGGQAGKLNPRIVYFQDPVYMLDTDFAALKGSVPARRPGEVAQTITTKKTDPQHVYYKSACLNCGMTPGGSTPTPAKTFAKLQAKQNQDTWNTPYVQMLIAIVVLLLMFLLLAAILTYINEVPDNAIVVIGRLITGTFGRQRPAPVPGGT